MSGIVGSKFNIRGSGLVGSLGTDGQHMLSSGAGKKHVFETVAAASAGLTKLHSITTADATTTIITFDSTYITSTYDLYLLTGWVRPENDAAYLLIRTQSSGSDDTGSSDYGVETGYYGYNGFDGDNDVGQIKPKHGGTFGGNQAGEGVHLQCWIANPTSSSYPTIFQGHNISVQQDGVHESSDWSAARYVSANDGISIYWDTDDHNTGSNLTLYGVTK